MKFLLILKFFISYLFFICAGLKCQLSSNRDVYLQNSTIEECWYPHNAFCATATFKNGIVPHLSCGDDEICTTKTCSDSNYCYLETYDYEIYPETIITVTCCDTDLCNVESSAKTFYRTCFSSLFYISVFYYLYFVTL